MATKTWDELAVLEPRLRDLLDEARHTTPMVDSERVFAVLFKPRIIDLVGWDIPVNRDETLASIEAYDVAYEKIYRALNCPDKRPE